MTLDELVKAARKQFEREDACPGHKFTRSEGRIPDVLPSWTCTHCGKRISDEQYRQCTQTQEPA